MLVTPLQMAMVAATVANGGIVPKPYVVQKIVAPDGSTVRNTKPGNLGRAIKPQTAADADPDDGRGRPGRHRHGGAIPGIQVAGKTGTAETGVDHVYTAWFVCFAPADNPQVRRRGRAREAVERLRRRRCGPDRKAVLQALLPWLRRPLPCSDPRGRLGHAHRNAFRRPLPGRAQARRRRHGQRLSRRGPGARPPRRDQDPERPPRERRAVRRALPPRGEERSGALASEHRLDLRPRRGRGHVLHRHGVPRRRTLKELIVRAAPRRSGRRRVRAADALGARASRTGTASCTATSSRTTSWSTPRDASR